MRYEENYPEVPDVPEDSEPVATSFDPEEPPSAEPVQVDPLDTTSPALGLPVLTTSPVEEAMPIEPTLITHPLKGDDWEFTLPSEDVQRRIQEDLALLGKYQGKQNGRWGNLSVHSIGTVVGYPVAVPDRELCVRIQEFAAELAGYSFTEESRGYLDEETWEDFVTALESGKR